MAVLTFPEMVVLDFDDTVILAPEFKSTLIDTISQELQLVAKPHDVSRVFSGFGKAARYVLSDLYDSADTERVRDVCTRLLRDPEQFQLAPGTEDFMACMADQDIPVFLASMSLRHRAVPIMEHFNLHFAGTVFKDDNVFNLPEKYRGVSRFLRKHEMVAQYLQNVTVGPADEEKRIGPVWVIGDSAGDLNAAKVLAKGLARESEVTFIAMGKNCGIAPDFQSEVQGNKRSNLSFVHLSDFTRLLALMP